MIKIGKSFWWILFLIGVIFIVSRLPELAQNLIFSRLFIFLTLFFGFSGLFSVFSIIGLKFFRTTRANRKQVGEIFSENFEVINRSIFPKVWVKISDQAEMLRGSGSRVLTWITGMKSRTYIAYSLLEKRGWFDLGPTQIETGDLFGLFLLSKKFAAQSRLLVIPFTFDLQKFPDPFGILPGGRALRQKTLDVTPYAAGVREFVHGDPLKRIHWPTSARKQKLIVKEFEKDPLAEVWIFIDMRGEVHLREEVKEKTGLSDLWWMRQERVFQLQPDTEEYAISIAASIAKYYIRLKRDVGLVTSGRGFTILPAERGERQLGKILETLAVLRAEGDLPFWGLISSQLAHLARGSTIILITPSGDQKILTVVMELIQRGLMPVVILIDPASFGGADHAYELVARLVDRGVLTFLIHKGDDIKAALESPQFAFDGRIIFRR